MYDTPTTPEPRSPWRRALREARIIIVVSALIAVTYNIFAVTSIPWLREVHQKDTTASAVADTANAGMPGDTATGGVDTVATATPIDTAAVPAIDSTKLAGLTKAQQDSIVKAQRDSVKAAKELATRQRDSLQQADLLKVFSGNGDINTDVAKRAFDKKMALFIDARPEDQFNASHIAGAMHIYAEQWQLSIPEIVKIPKDKPIITYCGGGDECELSHDLAKNLRAMGYTNVVVYVGGITDWNAKKYPVSGGQ